MLGAKQPVRAGWSHVFELASEADLLALKKIAAAARSLPGDAEDIAFLEARLPKPGNP